MQHDHGRAAAFLVNGHDGTVGVGHGCGHERRNSFDPGGDLLESRGLAYGRGRNAFGRLPARMPEYNKRPLRK
jgi:hypothetical protein